MKLQQKLPELLTNSNINWSELWHDLQRHEDDDMVRQFVATNACQNAFRVIVEPDLPQELLSEWEDLCELNGVGTALRIIAQDSLTEYYFDIADLVDIYGY